MQGSGVPGRGTPRTLAHHVHFHVQHLLPLVQGLEFRVKGQLHTQGPLNRKGQLVHLKLPIKKKRQNLIKKNNT